MLLAIDAGNTNIVFAVYDADTLRGQWRISTDAHRTADEYAIWLIQLMEMEKIFPKLIKAAVLASVVPQAVFELKQLSKRYFGTSLLVIGEEGVKSGIRVSLPRPSELGADRLVNAYAAWKKYGQALIIVDFGTATTFDVINASGDYIGGVIAPGVNLSLHALQQAAAKLPNISIAKPAAAIGADTVSAMQSGIYYGYIGLIEGIVGRIREELGHNAKVIATGGLAGLYAESASVIGHVEPDLTVWGLKEMYKLNR